MTIDLPKFMWPQVGCPLCDWTGRAWDEDSSARTVARLKALVTEHLATAHPADADAVNEYVRLINRTDVPRQKQ